jgi:hypothetical protein
MDRFPSIMSERAGDDKTFARGRFGLVPDRSGRPTHYPYNTQTRFFDTGRSRHGRRENKQPS